MKKSTPAYLLSLLIMTYAFTPAFAGDVEKKRKNTKPPQIEAVFVLDTTGSMSSLIAAAKEKIWAIGNTLSSADPPPDIKMGLVGYRDRGDQYITKKTALSGDIDDIYTHLVEFRAAGGGDGPESVNQALYEAVTTSNWSKDKNVYKVIFLVGDYPPHMDYEQDVKYEESCRLAREKDIIINTVLCGSNSVTKKVWEEIAQRGGGSFFQVAQSGNAAIYKTPYDREIAEASRELDSTRLYYGDKEDFSRARKKEAKSSSIYRRAKDSAVAQRAVFNAGESGKKNFLGSKELVDDWEKGRVDIDEVPETQLPGELKNLDLKKRKEKVKELNEKRQKLTKKIKELGKKRQAYMEERVKKDKKNKEASLEGLVYESVKKQAAEKEILIKGGPKY